MDIRALSFEDASFDVAIDKGSVILLYVSSTLVPVRRVKEPWMR